MVSGVSGKGPPLLGGAEDEDAVDVGRTRHGVHGVELLPHGGVAEDELLDLVLRRREAGEGEQCADGGVGIHGDLLVWLVEVQAGTASPTARPGTARWKSVSCWKASPALRTSPSSSGRPAIWNPSGSPPAVKPMGTDS